MNDTQRNDTQRLDWLNNRTVITTVVGGEVGLSHGTGDNPRPSRIFWGKTIREAIDKAMEGE